MGKKILSVLLVVVSLLSACTQKNEQVTENQSIQAVVEEMKAENKEHRVEEKEKITNSNWPYPPVDMNKAISDDPDVIKYLDYFIGPAQQVVFLEMGGEVISDKSMAVYSYLSAFAEDSSADHSIGVPKNELDKCSMKYFGRVPKSYESSMLEVDPETGNVRPTGWGGEAYYHVLEEKEELSDGTVRLIFNLVEPYTSAFEWPITYEEYKHAVYSGQLECLPDTGLRKEMILSERIDEDGEFYAQYHSARVVE